MLTNKRFLLLLFLMVFNGQVKSQELVSIYPADSSLSSVTLEVYVADHPKAAVVVCPGGSYCWLDYKGEGQEVARFLQKNGISAFVLRYRVAGWLAWFSHYRYLTRGNVAPDMYNDGQEALRWLKTNASRYGINPDHIGIMGFSAGGHLAMSQVVATKGIKPAFVAAIYPVVTMTDDFVHKRSRRGLLGESNTITPSRMEQWSIEKHVPNDCPPVFLVNCVDDPVVDYRNSVSLDSALTAAHVPHQYIQYKTGGHGFGVNDKKGSPECREWKYSFLKWMDKTISKNENLKPET